MTKRPKFRSFIGTILIILIVSIYALLATTIASATLATRPGGHICSTSC